MWIKLKNDGQTIILFGYSEQSDFDMSNFDIEIPYTIMLDKKGRIKYKYVSGRLVELTREEKNEHPLWKKHKANKKIIRLKERIRELRDLNEAKLSVELTASEKNDVDNEIARINSIPLTDAEDDL